MTERAVESWERYGSWVNMKTGPTGKERYISYGMYDLHDIAGLTAEARTLAGRDPKAPRLDAAMIQYIGTYERAAPVFNQAAAYYDSKGYEDDKAAEGQRLHKLLVPLAKSLIAEREALMPELRVFIRDVEQQEVAAIEAKQGRSAVWHVAQVLHAANRVFDLFPRNRPVPLSDEALEEKMKALGPDTPGEKFDEIIAGVEPSPGAAIDVKRFDEALGEYAKAVDVFDQFKGEKPDNFDDFDEFKPLPGELLAQLRAFQGPLKQSQGREFDGGGQMVGQMVERYFSMMNASGSMAGSRLRYLP